MQRKLKGQMKNVQTASKLSKFTNLYCLDDKILLGGNIGEYRRVKGGKLTQISVGGAPFNSFFIKGNQISSLATYGSGKLRQMTSTDGHALRSSTANQPYLSRHVKSTIRCMFDREKRLLIEFEAIEKKDSNFFGRTSCCALYLYIHCLEQ
jgi:hypothetical protein